MADQNSVDKRIVQMEFDNEQFKKGTNETIRALDRLTESLQFQDASKGLSNVESAINRINLSGLERDVGTLSSRFTLFGNLAFNALNRVSNKILDATGSVSSFISSLGQMANAASGFQKYEETVEATQTIMAATASEFEDTGEQMEFVSEQLDRLRWFTDETSYSFTDMASNIGKFTSAGVDLKTAVASMRGIAAWAALSGANAQKASIAMYNFSQSLGKGYMQLTDWRSLENINMATLEFKQQLIDLAIQMGKVEKVGEGMYHAIGANAAHVFSAEGMSEYLSDRWFDTELIQKVLAQYGDFSGKLNALGDATGFTASEMLNMMDEFREGTLDLEKYAKIGGVGVQFLTDALTDLTSADMALGEKGLRAAQETKTFSDAINYVKDAVSSGWAKTFELIIGNEQQAIDFWSKFAEEMYDIFVKVGDDRNELLAEWNEMGGRNLFIESIFNGLTAIKSLIEPIKEGIHDIFPPATAKTLYSITENIEKFTKGLILNAESQDKVRKAASKLASIFKGLSNIFKGFYSFSKDIGNALKPLWNVLKDISVEALNFTDNFVNSEETLKSFSGIGKGIVEIISSISTAISNLYFNLKNSKTFMGFIKQLSSIPSILLNFGSDTFKNISTLISNFLGIFKDVGVLDNFNNALDTTAKKTTTFGDIFISATKLIAKGFNNIFGGMKFSSIVKYSLIIYSIISVIKAIESLITVFRMVSIPKSISEIVESIADAADNFAKLLKAKSFESLAKSVMMLTGALFILSSISTDGLSSGLLSFSACIMSLVIIAKAIEGLKISPLTATSILEMSIAIGILALAFNGLSSVANEDWASISKKLTAFGSVVLALIAMGGALSLLSKFLTNGKWYKSILTSFNNLSLGALFIGLSVGIRLISGALTQIMQSGSETAINNGVKALTNIILALTFAVSVIEGIQAFKSSSFFTLSLLVISFSGSMLIIAEALSKLSAIPVEQLCNAGIAALTAFISMFFMLRALGVLASNQKGIFSGIAALMALALAINMLVGPVERLSKIPFDSLVNGILTISAELMVLIIALYSLGKLDTGALDIIGMSAGLILLSISIDMLSGAIKRVSEMDLDAIGNGIITIAAALALIGLGAYFASTSGIAEALIILDGALVLLAASAYIFASAVDVLVNALVKLTQIAPEAIQSLANSVVTLAPAFGQSIAIIFESLIQAFDEKVPLLAQHFVSGIVKAIFAAIEGAVKGLAEGVTSLIGTVLDILDGAFTMKSFAAEKGAETVSGYAEGASSEAGNLNRTMSDIGQNAANAVSSSGLNGQNGNQIGLDFLSAITGASNTEGANLIQALTGVGEGGVNAVSYFMNAVTGGGIATDFMGGMNDAIGQNANTILNNLIRFGNNAVSVTSSALNAVTTMISTMNSAYATGQKLSKETSSQLQKQRAEAVQKTNKSQLKGAAARMAIVESDLGTKTYDYSKEVRAAMSQLNNYGQQALDDWKKFSSDYVSSTDWKSIGSAAGNELGEGLKSGAGGGGGSGRKGGASGTAKEMAKVIEGECKVVMNETGHYIAENICAGLKEDSTIEEVAAGKAKNIKSAFQEVFDQFDLYQDYYDAQYDLWVAANPDATEIEKRRQELKNLGQQMTTVTKKLNAAQDELAQLSEELGEGSNEVVTMATEVTRLKTELENLNNTYNERAQLEPGVYIPEADLYQNGEIDYREVGMVFPEELVNMLAEIKGDFKSSGEELAAELTAGMTGQLTDDEEYLLTSIRTLMETTEVPILDSYDNYVDAGENLIFGFAKGITSKNALARVEESSAYVANLATDTLNATLDINSPSKVAGISGRFFDEGFANNIVKYAFMSEDATQAMGESTIGILRDTLKTVSDLVTADYEYSPVIKPIVDTTNVATAADYITSTFATPSSIRLGSRPDTPFNRNLRAIRLSMQDQEDYNYSREDETVNAINNLGSKLDKQEAAIRAMQVVMDSGELVGSIAGGMDQGLGTRAKYKRRGN